MERKKTKTTNCVNILGTEYEIDSVVFIDETTDAQIDPVQKKILIRAGAQDGDDDTDHKRLLRHELTHGFFIESGLRSEYNDERIVEWIALQFPKMLKAFQETKAI